MHSRIRNSPRMIAAAALAAAAALWPATAHSQRIEIAPAYGMYFPIGEWTQENDGGTGFAPIRRQLPAHMLSARLTAWPTNRLGLEGTISFSPSQVAMSVDGNTRDIHGGVFVASARALFKVASLDHGETPQRRETWDLLVGAGGGLVHRGGSAWDNTSGVTRPALVFVAGMLMPLAPSLTWRVSLEDFVTWTQFDAGRVTQTHARVHHDLVGSLSVAIRLGGRR